ncbi:MAG TPA: hypothetical protein VGC45_15620 [Gryllotalpicola sp.]
MNARIADLLDQDFPHGTPAGYDAGCQGSHCNGASGLTCCDAKKLVNGSFRAGRAWARYAGTPIPAGELPAIVEKLAALAADDQYAKRTGITPRDKPAKKTPADVTPRTSGEESPAALIDEETETAAPVGSTTIVETAEDPTGEPETSSSPEPHPVEDDAGPEPASPSIGLHSHSADLEDLRAALVARLEHTSQAAFAAESGIAVSTLKRFRDGHRLYTKPLNALRAVLASELALPRAETTTDLVKDHATPAVDEPSPPPPDAVRDALERQQEDLVNATRAYREERQARRLAEERVAELEQQLAAAEAGGGVHA